MGRAEDHITDLDLLAAYNRTSLAVRGVSFDAAKASPAIMKGLRGTVIAQRKRAARQALANPASHHTEKEVA